MMSAAYDREIAHAESEVRIAKQRLEDDKRALARLEDDKRNPQESWRFAECCALVNQQAKVVKQREIELKQAQRALADLEKYPAPR